ncbi:MAG TPA: hypothetical protein VJ206_02255 [bacterium]|jgi:hypothetical protein|nr:hypothetical protein [bacterium]
MDGLTEDDLLRLAGRLGWPLDRDRIKVILPEVQRLLDAASRLRELPIDPAAPPRDPA